MADSTASEWLDKHQAQELGRHHRTLGDDRAKAFRSNDLELLQFCRVILQDESTLLGKEVAELPDDSKQEILVGANVSHWEYLPAFVETIHQRKNNRKTSVRSDSSTGKQPKQDSSEARTLRNQKQDPAEQVIGEPPPLPDDPSSRAIVLEHLHYVNQKNEKNNDELMKRILDLVENNQELQKQTNTLFNQFQEAQKELASGSGQAQSKSKPESTTSPGKPSNDDGVVDVTPTNTSRAADGNQEMEKGKEEKKEAASTPKKTEKKSPAKKPKKKVAKPSNKSKSAKKKSKWKFW